MAETPGKNNPRAQHASQPTGKSNNPRHSQPVGANNPRNSQPIGKVTNNPRHSQPVGSNNPRHSQPVGSNNPRHSQPLPKQPALEGTVADAMPDDGVLDMLLVGNVGLSTFLRLVGKYAKGRYRDYPDLIRDFHGQEITWRSDRELVTVVDGEVLRDTAFTVRLSERKVNFFYPAGESYAPEI